MRNRQRTSRRRTWRSRILNWKVSSLTSWSLFGEVSLIRFAACPASFFAVPIFINSLSRPAFCACNSKHIEVDGAFAVPNAVWLQTLVDVFELDVPESHGQVGIFPSTTCLGRRIGGVDVLRDHERAANRMERFPIRFSRTEKASLPHRRVTRACGMSYSENEPIFLF
ncbi:MAG: hypothetical protein M0T84_17015 [Betaproteobacteria bacterium]|nr:hypothetical protein [Betaproteobacteria bacterium]